MNPTIPSPLAPLSPLVGVPISGIYIDPNLRTPYVQQYNANAEWEFAKNYLLEVGYVGSKGTKLLQVITLNQPVYNRATNSFTAPFGTALSVQKNVAGGIQQVQSTSNSHYDSLQVSGTKRFGNGLQFLSAYTLGKSIDSYSGGTINELAATPGDQFNWKTNRGLSDFDRRPRFVQSFVYDLPPYKTDSSFAKALLNGWELAGILFDPRGVARSEQRAEPVTIRLLADDVAALLDALAIKRAHILGASFGGFVAQEFALAYPERSLSLSLCCTSFGGPRHVPPSVETLQALASTKGLNTEARVRENLLVAFSKQFVAEHPAEIEQVIKLRAANFVPEHVYLHQLQAAMAFDTEARVADIKAPTLVLTGDADTIVPPQNSRNLAALITLNAAEATEYARAHGIAHENLVDLTRQPQLRELVQAIITNVNARVSSTEAIKRFAILERDFQIEADEVTPTLKVKREINAPNSCSPAKRSCSSTRLVNEARAACLAARA